jgi:hypothetical protein
MAITTTSVSIVDSSWTLVHTAGSTTPGFQVHCNTPVLFKVASATPTGSAEAGSIVKQPRDANGEPMLFDITIDSGDKVYARAQGGSGAVTVVA